MTISIYQHHRTRFLQDVLSLFLPKHQRVMMVYDPLGMYTHTLYQDPSPCARMNVGMCACVCACVCVLPCISLPVQDSSSSTAHHS